MRPIMFAFLSDVSQQMLRPVVGRAVSMFVFAPLNRAVIAPTVFSILHAFLPLIVKIKGGKEVISPCKQRFSAVRNFCAFWVKDELEEKCNEQKLVHKTKLQLTPTVGRQCLSI